MSATSAVFPLTTERLIIDVLGAHDIDAFVAYRRIPDVARYQSWEADYPRGRAEELVAGQRGRDIPASGEWMQYGARRIDDGVLVGDVAVHALADQPATFEIGCTVAPHAQRQGFAVEAMRAVVGALFRDGDAHRVMAACDARNTASIAALRRVGMRHESRIVEADWFKGEWTTVDAFAILAREFAAGRVSRPRRRGPDRRVS